MDNGTGLELSILEGMDEALLERLYQAGIKCRGDLAARIAGPDERLTLARELGVSARRLQILHHLNFLLPEERAERELDLERRVKERAEAAERDMRRLWRVLILALGASLAGLVAVIFLPRPERSAPKPEMARLEARVQELERSLAALLPIGRAHAEERVLSGLASLGPAPGWVVSRPWTTETHEQLTRLLGNEPGSAPPRAVSLLLLRLCDLEKAPWDSLSPLGRAQEAADVLAGFPAPVKIGDVWDAAAVLLRTRLRGRALGLFPPESQSTLPQAAGVWEWTSPGYLSCEELLAGLESMAIRAEALDMWSRTLLQIRDAADLGKQARAGLPEASARDYWLRRAELEYAVTAALLGRGHLLPYNASSPRAFLEVRKTYLAGALENAVPAAKPGLAWLLVEYEEGLRLVDWLELPGNRGTGSGAGSWVQALDEVEQRRRPSGLQPGAEVEAALRRAVLLSGEGGEYWTAPRTRLEGGLRPVLMETRAGARERRDADRSGS